MPLIIGWTVVVAEHEHVVEHAHVGTGTDEMDGVREVILSHDVLAVRAVDAFVDGLAVQRLREKVAEVLGPRHLTVVDLALGHDLLDPEVVGVLVSNLTEPASLQDPERGLASANKWPLNPTPKSFHNLMSPLSSAVALTMP